MTRVSRAALDRMAAGAVHQGVVAQAAAHTYAEVEDILRLAESRGEDPLLVLLDGLEDPHNLGAIMRSAECAGAHGIIIPKHASVGLTETVAKASAGAIEYMPVARVTNLVRTMEELKEENRRCIDAFTECNEKVTIIESDFKATIEAVLEQFNPV